MLAERINITKLTVCNVDGDFLEGPVLGGIVQAQLNELELIFKNASFQEFDNYNYNRLNELISNIGSLASVYHKPVSSFVDGAAYRPTLTLTQQQSQAEAQGSVIFINSYHLLPAAGTFTNFLLAVVHSILTVCLNTTNCRQN